MEVNNNDQNKVTREFKLTTFALNNKTTMFVILVVVLIFGALSYTLLPKELFPDVNYPTILVQTTYPGNPPPDIENLISRPLEKELKTLKDVNEVSSISAQDASMVFVEFNADIDVDDVIDDVKDAVDKAKPELPDDLPVDPLVMDVDFSEFPILNINLSGDYSLEELKEYAEFLQDEIETVGEISKAPIKGLNEREVEIRADPFKMEVREVSFNDIRNAISYENVSMSGGEIKLGDTRWSVRVIGEFTSAKDMENLVVKHNQGDIVYLRDIAEVVDGYAEPTSFARLNRHPVVSVEVIKKGGENLLDATDQVFAIVEQAKANGDIPEDIHITYTNDQSKHVRNQLDNLQNSIVLGVIFVVMVLYFFLGFRNALFVGLAIPLSMFLSFVVLGLMGATINMIVLFSLILALGMLVDNAIVVVENTYRFVDQGYSIAYAAKHAAGEIAIPIIASTATTLAAFFPLIFWESIMGEFMRFLPVTLIIVLTSSLVVALVILPVLASSFIKVQDDEKDINRKKSWIAVGALVALSLPFYAIAAYTFANLIMIFALLGAANLLILSRMAKWFRQVFLTRLEAFYMRFMRFTLKGRMPYLMILGTVGLLIVTMIFFGMRQPKVEFFPQNEPQNIFVFAEMPIGTDVVLTDSMTRIIESDLEEVIGEDMDIVESMQTTVGEGVSRSNEFAVGTSPHKARIIVKFVDYMDRHGVKTSDVMKRVSESLTGRYAGVDVFVEKDQNGPPTGSPINIEVSGKEMEQLIPLTDSILAYLESYNIDGVEKLKLNITLGKPDLIVKIDRDKARRFGLSTMQIAFTIRTALFGDDISDFKEDEDEHDVVLRLSPDARYNLATLLNQRITFRNMRGQIVQVPISAVASVEPSSSYSSVRRKDMKRVITIYSNVLEGYNANEVNAQLKVLLRNFDMPQGYSFKFTGEQEEQAETMDFLVRALAIAIALILTILVSQFNSVIKPFIILASVLFSTIGVFGGIATFKMDFVVMMTGIGIISLAGVVVNNAIVLIDYIDFLKLGKRKEMGLAPGEMLPSDAAKECIMQAGQTRLRPVLLTAITTILGLLPMAVGLNINFETMLSDFNPDLYFGGDNSIFWGPMAWTVIFGLTFATFLTLVIVPAMYLLATQVKIWSLKLIKRNDILPPQDKVS